MARLPAHLIQFGQRCTRPLLRKLKLVLLRRKLSLHLGQAAILLGRSLGHLVHALHQGEIHISAPSSAVPHLGVLQIVEG